MINEDLYNIRLEEVKKDVYYGIKECNKRGLIQTAKWLAELNHGLNHVEVNYEECETEIDSGIYNNEYDDYCLAKTYFDCREYDRAAYFTKNCESKVPKFLFLYSTYMSKEKKHIDNMTENTTQYNSVHAKGLTDMLTTLKAEHAQKKLDGYSLYLYGVILKKLDLTQLAVSVFLEAVNLVPTLWAAWLELSPLITDNEKLMNLKLPNHWMKHFFIAHTLIELFLNNEGLKYYEELQQIGFRKCVYITTQTALAYQNKREVERAIEIFEEIQKSDPYRLDYLDIYSNLLFVKELKTEMAFLAHRAVEINKYRPETCCVIGKQ